MLSFCCFFFDVRRKQHTHQTITSFKQVVANCRNKGQLETRPIYWGIWLQQYGCFVSMFMFVWFLFICSTPFDVILWALLKWKLVHEWAAMSFIGDFTQFTHTLPLLSFSFVNLILSQMPVLSIIQICYLYFQWINLSKVLNF